MKLKPKYHHLNLANTFTVLVVPFCNNLANFYKNFSHKPKFSFFDNSVFHLVFFVNKDGYYWKEKKI
jgi:hypothetical protein